MHVQPNLFAPMLARSHHRQDELFDQAGAVDADSDLRCTVCQSFLVRTASRYLCCLRGHEKLVKELTLPADPPDGSQPWLITAAETARIHARNDR